MVPLAQHTRLTITLLLLCIAICCLAIPTVQVDAKAGAVGSGRATTAVSTASRTPTFGPIEMRKGQAFYRTLPTFLVSARLRHLISKYLTRPFPTDSVLVASFVDSSLRDAQKIQDASGENHRDIQGLGDIKKLIADENPRVIILVGHSENGVLKRNIIQNDNSTISSEIQLKDLPALTATGLLIFIMTCRGAEQVGLPSVVDDLYTPEIISRLSKSIKASTYSEFYAAMGSVENPSVLQGVEDALFTELVLTAVLGTTEVSINVIDVNMPQPEPEPTGNSFISFLSSASVIALIGWSFVQLARRMAREAREGYPISDRSTYRPMRHDKMTIVGTLTEVNLDNDPEAITLLSRLPSTSALKPLLDETIKLYRTKKVSVIEARTRLYQLAERARPFPPISDLALDSEEYITLRDLFQSFEPPEEARELILNTMAWRRNSVKRGEFVAALSSIAKRIKEPVHRERAAGESTRLSVSARSTHYQWGNGCRPQPSKGSWNFYSETRKP